MRGRCGAQHSRALPCALRSLQARWRGVLQVINSESRNMKSTVLDEVSPVSGASARSGANGATCRIIPLCFTHRIPRTPPTCPPRLPAAVALASAAATAAFPAPLLLSLPVLPPLPLPLLPPAPLPRAARAEAGAAAVTSGSQLSDGAAEARRN